MNILVTGGCGFVGSALVPFLLDIGHSVTVVDTQWFGKNLAEHENLKIVQEDVRKLSPSILKKQQKVIHLANIANDPAVDLNPELSWEVNVLATQQLIDAGLRYGNIDQFIFASSGSVYGVKKEKKVTEDLELVPISAYNKTKMVAERVVLSYQNYMKVHCIRPATVCGVSKRMRLDVAVNMLTMQALTKGEITVLGGSQTRPNIHIEDMVRVYDHFVKKPTIPSGTYNAGFENITILEIAKMVSRLVPTKIIIEKSNDPRSYRQDSTKLIETGFEKTANVEKAIRQIIEGYKSGEIEDKEEYYTVKTMKKLGL